MRSIKPLMTGWLFFSLICCGSFLNAQENEGEPLLDEAMQLKIDAKTPRDFDKVADLCEEALDKGLEEGSKKTAKQLWASSNFEHAKLLSKEIFTPRPDRRWKFKRQQALDRLETAVELTPELTDAWLLIAQLNLMEGGDKEQAEEAVTKALENADETDAATRSKSLLLRAQLSDDEEKKMEDIAKALEVDPKNKLALRLRGRTYVEQEKYDEAIEDFTKLAEAQENNPADLVLLAEVLRTQNKNDIALKALDAAIDVNGEIPVFGLRALLNLAEGNTKEAFEDAEKAIDMNARDVEALRTRANILLQREQFEDAMKDVEKVLMFREGDLQTIYLRCFIYEGMKDYKSAIADMEQLAQMIPDEPGFQMTLARLHNGKGDKEKALEIYEDLLKEDDENYEIYRSRGDLHLSNGDHKDAVADYEKALEMDGDGDDGVLNNLAWVLSTSTFEDVRDGKRALELAEKAAEMTEYKQAHILSTLAAAYAESGDFEKAVEWSEKAVEIADEGRQKKDLIKELETLKAGDPIRENEGEEKEDADEDDEEADDSDEESDDDDDSEDEDGDDDDSDGIE